MGSALSDASLLLEAEHVAWPAEFHVGPIVAAFTVLLIASAKTEQGAIRLAKTWLVERIHGARVGQLLFDAFVEGTFKHMTIGADVEESSTISAFAVFVVA
jgi:hypothetical protein